MSESCRKRERLDRDHEIIQQMRDARKEKEESALDLQVGGDHYKGCGIQPVEYIHANNLGYLEGNVIKYITRHRTKGEGRKDIEKAIHYAQLILELEYNQQETVTNDH
tara:strand:+ start:152 stop:475 length:324 start_codon:yes stop_codon:yes gene_type:complete